MELPVWTGVVGVVMGTAVLILGKRKT